MQTFAARLLPGTHVVGLVDCGTWPASVLLQIYARHTGFVVALARGLRKLRIDARQVVRCQLDVDRAGVLLEVRAALGAGDRDQVVAACEHPRDRELRRA